MNFFNWLIEPANSTTNIPIPTIQEVSEYGSTNGVLIALLVAIIAICIYFMLNFTRYFLDWHERQLREQRDFYNAHNERIHTRLDTLFNEVSELTSLPHKINR